MGFNIPSSGFTNLNSPVKNSGNPFLPENLNNEFNEETTPESGEPVVFNPTVEDVIDENFTPFTGDSPTRVNTVLNCFVDLNLEIDENRDWNSEILNVTFNSSSYSVDEGGQIDVFFKLNKPSVYGSEELGLILSEGTAILSEDYETTNQPFEGFPVKVTWDVGQQTKKISFSIFSDGVINEGVENFKLRFDNLKNVTYGPIPETTINIQDLTSDPTIVRLDGGSIISEPGKGGSFVDKMFFSINEGEDVDIVVTLDSPSEYGTEKVTVELENVTSSVGDVSIVSPSSPYLLEWGVGDLEKIFTVKALTDGLPEGIERAMVKLTNPVNTILATGIGNFTSAEIDIVESPPKKNYFKINLPDFYVQRGGAGVTYGPETQSRIAQDGAYGESTWAIKFGVPIESLVGQGPVPGNNGWSDTDLFQNTINHYFFGVDPRDGSTGDLKFTIKNKGIYPVDISGQTIGVNDYITLDVTNSNFEVLLETNNAYIPAGTSINGSTPASEGFLEKGSYEFSFYVDYSEHSFVLKDSGNTQSPNKTIQIGEFNYFTGDTISNAIQNPTAYNLTSRYKNIRTNKFPTIGSGNGTCQTNFSNSTYSVKDIRINGIYFLDNKPHSEYNGFEFLEPLVPCNNSSCCNISGNEAPLSDYLKWTTIAFKQ